MLARCCAAAAASGIARAAWLAGGGNDVAAEVFTLLRMDGLLLGSWIALAARGSRRSGVADSIGLANADLGWSRCDWRPSLLGMRVVGPDPLRLG